MEFLIVDAFTDSPYGGNTAGVVILPEGKDFPDDKTMVKVAAELRYSETAFVKVLGGGAFHTRYFTPADEVDLCGHATIGTFKALLHKGIIAGDGTYTNQTLAGLLQIYIKDGLIFMDMASPSHYGVLSGDVAARTYAALGVDVNSDEISKLPLRPQLISTGLIDIMVPLRSEEELADLKPDFPAISKLSDELGVVGIHAFTPPVQAADGSFVCHARNFAPLYAIDEEAATGTSNGALACYLYAGGVIPAEAKCRVVQGEAMGRASEIFVELVAARDASGQVCPVGELPEAGAKAEDTQVLSVPCAIKVGGSSAVVAEGQIYL